MNTEVDELQVDSVAPYQEDEIWEELAALLSRLASLQGVAVPAHRFVYQQKADSGVSLDNMQQIDQAVAIWSQRFLMAPSPSFRLRRSQRKLIIQWFGCRMMVRSKDSTRLPKWRVYC